MAGKGKRNRRYANWEGSCYKRQDGRWSASLPYKDTEGKTRRTWTTRKTKKDALAWLNQQRVNRDGGVPLGGENPALADYLKDWLAYSVKGNVAEATYKNYASMCKNHIIPTLGHIKIKDLSPHDVQRLYAMKRDAGLSLVTRQRIHTTLRKALAKAHGWGSLSANVAVAVGRPKGAAASEHEEVKPFSEEELARIYEAAKNNRLYALYVLAPATGLREQELLALRWSDLTLPDAGRGSVRVERAVVETENSFAIGPTKNKSSRRTVEFPASVVTVLKEHRQRQLKERMAASEYKAPELVFTNFYGGMLNRYRLGYYWRPLRDKAGLGSDRHFSDFRHTFATLLFVRGWHPKAVQEVMGHSSIRLTMDTYSHWLVGSHPDIGDALSDLF